MYDPRDELLRLFGGRPTTGSGRWDTDRADPLDVMRRNRALRLSGDPMIGQGPATTDVPVAGDALLQAFHAPSIRTRELGQARTTQPGDAGAAAARPASNPRPLVGEPREQGPGPVPRTATRDLPPPTTARPANAGAMFDRPEPTLGRAGSGSSEGGGGGGFWASRRQNIDAGIAGIAQAFARNPNPTLGQIGAAMAGGVAEGEADRRDAALEERQLAMQEEYYGSKAQTAQLEAEAATAEAARREQLLATLPPEQRQLYELFGDKAADAFMPKPFEPKTMEVQGGVVQIGPDNKPTWLVPPKAERGPEAPETWRQLSPEQATAAGYLPGSVVSVSSRGQHQVEQAAPKPGGGITLFDDQGNPVAEIGGDGASAAQGTPQAVKLPQGYAYADPSDEARAEGITGRVAKPVAGTPDYHKAVNEVETVKTFGENVSKLAELHQQHGATVWPSEARGQIQSIENNLKLSYAQLTGQGALQEADKAVIEDVLGSLSSWWNLSPGTRAETVGKLQNALSIADREAVRVRRAYPWAKVPGVRRPKALEPSPQQAPAQQAGGSDIDALIDDELRGLK